MCYLVRADPRAYTAPNATAFCEPEVESVATNAEAERGAVNATASGSYDSREYIQLQKQAQVDAETWAALSLQALSSCLSLRRK